MEGAEPDAIEHPPHVHRLLRLIREGTPSHASRASALLGRYAASCCAGVVVGAGDATGGPGDGHGNRPAAPSNPGCIIWDLIGRLVGGDGAGNAKSGSEGGGRGGKRRKKGKKDSRPTSGLFDANWATRTNCALALEYVARCLPLEDRRNFFEGVGGTHDVQCEDGKMGSSESSDESLWLSVSDLSKPTSNIADNPETKVNREKAAEAGPTLSARAVARNQLDVVAERGRLLLSSSGEQYDWDCDDETKEYIREHEALKSLDATAVDPSHGEGDSTEGTQQSFLVRRVRLQRQILARRLGLGGILSAPIVAGSGSASAAKGGRIVDDIVADEDLAPTSAPKSKGTGRTPKARGKGAKQPKSKKRKRPKQSNLDKTPKEKDPGISIRALLVLESKRRAEDGIGRKQTHHGNPQTLLGSELAYRTFDPDWAVRHGAMLGTLALLRAWRVHEAPRVAANDSENYQQRPQAARKFGTWPQDILARCICILALDQFADFSGVSLEGTDSSDTVDDIASGAIVAPVREMAAQITAILLETAPSDVGDCAHRLLMQLYTRHINSLNQRGTNGWEIRHGVLLTWKYVCAMALFHSQRCGRQLEAQASNGTLVNLRPLSMTPNPLSSDFERCHVIFNNLILQAVRGLSDVSDDNRAVAAQVLRHTMLIDGRLHTTEIARESSTPLWNAMMNIREGVSSCAADLLHLLAELLSHDCATFLSCLKEMSLDAILQKLTGFIGDDSIHVRISCFGALRLVAEPIATATLDIARTNNSPGNATIDQSTADCATALCQLLIRLFETYFNPEYISGTFLRKEDDTVADSAQALSNCRNEAWSTVLHALALMAQCDAPDARSPCLDVVDNAFATLLLRYLSISKPEKSNQHVTRIQDSITVGDRELSTEISYSTRVMSAHALAQFHTKIYPSNQRANLSNKIHTIIQSPWLHQSEAGYLLHTSLASLMEDSAGVPQPFFAKYLSYMIGTFDKAPTSILLEENDTFTAALDDPHVQSICDTGVAKLLGGPQSCTEEVVRIWENTFMQRGVDFEDLRKSPLAPLTKSSMRLSASISGALVACGSKHLPPKITPLIRALMTSLKNEESHSRRVDTCRYISQLVSILAENPTHEKARNKLIENVCSIACQCMADSSGSSNGAEQVIEMIIAGMSPNTKLEDYPPIWNRLSPLLDEVSWDKSDQQQSESIFMLRVISKATSKDSPEFSHLLNAFIRPAVNAACKSGLEIVKSQACKSINNFCQTDFSAAMNLVVPSLLFILSNLEDDSGREGGCALLLSILHDFEVLASPYVTSLLPVAMRLMADAREKCSRLAASTFAILVRIAPLAANHLEKQVVTMPNQNASNGVIRHLILGRPLPPCVFPEAIVSELKQSGTTLRPYQVEGISWLKFLSDVHLNGALCDDMGLGKTLQALIGIALSHCDKSDKVNESAPAIPRNNKKSLVVCPSSVVGHWVSEIKRFFPGNRIFACFDFTGNAKTRRAAWQKAASASNIVVTSYSVLRSDVNLLETTLWDWCILDEGHLLKNPKTATAKASRRLKARHKLILTGTPIQNNVHELWATFDFLMPNFLGTEKSFLSEFAKPIVKSQSSDASAADINHGMECLKILHQQVLPFVLRREKSQVIKELPPKIITDVPCALSKQQHAIYQQTLKCSGTKEALDMVDRSLADTEEQGSDATSPPKLGSDVLTSLLQLRLVCTHPLLHSLFSSKKSGAAQAPRNESVKATSSFARLDCSGKLSALNDLLRHAGIAEPELTAADHDESAFLFDANDTLAEGSDVDCLEGTTYDTVDDPPNDDAPEASTTASKCLIFAQFTQSLDIIERLLFEPHMPSLRYLRLDGRVPANTRHDIAEKFNDDPTVRVLLLTTKVGGLGLNLTGADKVIFLEPDWNPYVDLQAMDRAHRIGQTRTVNVYRLVTSHTVEEKMMKLQQRKKATSEAVVNAENSTMYSMGTDRLLDIFTCRGEEDNAGASKKGEAGNDDVLSYLDAGKPDEYASLTVDGFLRGLM